MFGPLFQLDRQQCDTLADVVVKLSGDPGSFLLLCLNQPAAHAGEGRFRQLALGDVHHGTHELLHIPRCVQDRMADGVSVFESAVRKKDSVFPFVIRLFTDCAIGYLSPVGSVLRMHALQAFFPSRRALFWIKAIYAIPFLGEIHGASSCYLPGGTPGMRESLRFS